MILWEAICLNPFDAADGRQPRHPKYRRDCKAAHTHTLKQTGSYEQANRLSSSTIGSSKIISQLQGACVPR